MVEERESREGRMEGRGTEGRKKEKKEREKRGGCSSLSVLFLSDSSLKGWDSMYHPYFPN